MVEWLYENKVEVWALVAAIYLAMLVLEFSMNRYRKEVEALSREGHPAVNLTKENHGTKVVVSQAYFWEPIDTAPLGCKVQLKTIPGGVATYGEVSERNRKHFSAWAPLPTTRKP